MVKTKLLYLIFTACFFLIIAKLFYIQVINPKGLPTDYLRTNKIFPERGKIFDRSGEPLVVNQTTYLLYAEPKKISDYDYYTVKISEALNTDPASIEAKFDQTKDWVAMKSGIDKETKEQIESFKLEGIGFQNEAKRYYPEASLSAHLLGFVGKNEVGDSLGYFGIEGFYDKDLTGLPGLIKTERDLFGRPIFVGTQQKLASENGRDLLLTLDKSVQEIIKSKLIQGLEKYEAKQGCIIVANPMTMEILGLVCLPDFDPDQYYRFSEDYFKNTGISDLYEPGSIFKPVVMATALEENIIKPDDTYDEAGPVIIDEYSIKTWNDKYEGKITMTRILEKSSNVGMVYIGQKLGNKKLYQGIKEFGLGQLTGIDLQGEVSGYLKPEKDWYQIDFATASFGQGIAVTPIQMITAFSAIINGGNLYKPYVVSRLISGNKENEVKPKLIRKVISEKTSKEMVQMLISTVEKGDASWIKPTGYRIGGKTGTAQIPIKGHYDPTKTIASFIGFMPTQNPKFIALVVLKEPQTSPWGSETAAPLFFDIAKELIVYYNIAPD